MKTKTFQLKEILPNPFRRTEKYPLLESKIEDLMESIEATEFWENVVVRINDDGKPELAYGHHRLAALKKIYPGTKEFDWIVRDLTDGAMIQLMARENCESYSTNPAVLRETIQAAVEAHGQGRILFDEMPLDPSTRRDQMRYAPGFSTPAVSDTAGVIPERDPKAFRDFVQKNHGYTLNDLAKFLGLMQPKGDLRPSFIAAFGAVELLSEGYLTDAKISGLESHQLASLVAAVKQQRTKALAEAKRLAEEAEARRKEVERKAAELKKQQEESEARRKAAAEAERLAAIKRAEEKAKRDAEEKIRLAAEAKRREEEAKQRAIAEEKRKKEEAERRVAAELRRKEEEEKQCKIREGQQAEAKKRAEEAEHQRQIALAKAKKEADERKAAQMIRDAEAAAARADSEAKRKVEAARQAEIAAKKKIEDDKAREAAAAKKREDDERVRQAAEAKRRYDDEAREKARRKAQQEAEARKEAERVEAARLKILADKKAADDAARRKQEEIDRAVAEAKKKDEEARKEAAAAKAKIKAVADTASSVVANMTRKDIRESLKEKVEEAAHRADVSAGRHSAPRAEISMSEEKLRQFMNAVRSTPQSVLGGKNIPKNVVAMAKELISAGRKILAQKKHPDAGGSEAEMMILNAAHQWLTLLINQSEEK